MSQEQLPNATQTETGPAAEGAPTASPQVLGDLLPEEKNALMSVKASYNEALMRVGEAYLRLNALAQRSVDLDSQARSVLDGVLFRLGVEKNPQGIQVLLDESKVIRMR